MGTEAQEQRASRTRTQRHLEDESASSEVFRALHEIAVATGGVLEPSELARLVVDHACSLLGADGAGLYLSDDAGGKLLPVHSSDANAASAEPAFSVGQGAAGEAFLTGEPVCVPDYTSWGNAGSWARARGVRAALAVPLKVADRRV